MDLRNKRINREVCMRISLFSTCQRSIDVCRMAWSSSSHSSFPSSLVPAPRMKCLYVAVVLVGVLLLADLTQGRSPRRRHRQRSQSTLNSTHHWDGDGILRASKNPLKDQPNLSSKRKASDDKVIYGSRKAVTVTKLEYLKKQWCKSEPLEQVIREEGCLRRTVINRFCYGQCNSFFIPKSDEKDLESGAFMSCAFCKPKRYRYITVTLRCPNKRPRIRRKKIQIVKQCKCMAQPLT